MADIKRPHDRNAAQVFAWCKLGGGLLFIRHKEKAVLSFWGSRNEGRVIWEVFNGNTREIVPCGKTKSEANLGSHDCH